MTRGRWFILGLIIILVALIFWVIKDKRTKIANQSVSPLIELSSSNDPKPSLTAAAVDNVSTEQTKQTTPKNARHLQVIVLDENSRPLVEAQVRSIIRASKEQTALTNFNAKQMTEANGAVDVLFPAKEFKQLEISVSKTNYSSQKMTWDFATGDQVPPSYIIKLKRGFNIGGFVVDPEGNPIADATVWVRRFWSGSDEGPKSKGEQPSFSSEKRISDAQGRWSVDDLPLELISNIAIDARHTNFINTRVEVDDPKAESALRAKVYQLVMKRGIDVFGRVLDEQDNPIEGANVWAGQKYSRNRQETKSDAQGGFVFRNIGENDTAFSVMAKDFSPTNIHQKITAETPEIIFKLTKGTVIAGKVVNKAGEPIESVRVILTGSPGHPAYDHYEFEIRTDRNGEFKWTGAPNEPMPFTFFREGYQDTRDTRLYPDKENIITLLRKRQVQGYVVDADTGEPVTQFRVALGEKTGGQILVQSYDKKDITSREGTFIMDVKSREQNGIQVTATGYADQNQFLPAGKDDEPLQVEFKLKPSPSLEGVVIRPNGQPAAGALVALVEDIYGGAAVQFSNGRITSQGSRSKIIITDATGHFSIVSPPESGMVVASSEEGSGSTSIAEVRASGVLKLQPFGRIEGVILRGASLVEGQEMVLSSPKSGIYFDFNGYKTISDVYGRFTLEKVPAGSWTLIKLIKSSDRSWLHGQTTPVIVTGGQTTQITIGGVDATLQSHVSFETEPKETDITITARLITPLIEIPAGLSVEERKAFTSTPEWKEQIKNRKSYQEIVGKDGSLSFDTVPPGDYVLTVKAQKQSEDYFLAKPIAQSETKVTVPVGSNPASPINIGNIILRSPK